MATLEQRVTSLEERVNGLVTKDELADILDQRFAAFEKRFVAFEERLDAKLHAFKGEVLAAMQTQKREIVAEVVQGVQDGLAERKSY